MADLSEQILAAVGRKSYKPLKPKALARKLGVPRRSTPTSARRCANCSGRAASRSARTTTIRPAAAARHRHRRLPPHRRPASASSGRTPSRARPGPEIRVREDDALDAATGDEVLVKHRRKPSRADLGPRGEVMQRPRTGDAAVRRHLLRARGRGLRPRGRHRLQPQHLRRRPRREGAPSRTTRSSSRCCASPSPDDRGEGVITEVLGPRGQPGVDTLSVIRAFDLPDEFPEDVLEEARERGRRVRRGRPRRPRGLHRATRSSPSTRPTPATSTTPSR